MIFPFLFRLDQEDRAVRRLVREMIRRDPPRATRVVVDEMVAVNECLANVFCVGGRHD